MVKPQSPEVRRSGTTDLDPDSIGSALEAQRAPGSSGPTGPVPTDNQPGHHPARDQDRPPLDAFAERLGIGRAADTDRAAAPDASGTSEPGAGDLVAQGLAIAASAARLGAAVVRYAARSATAWWPGRH